MLRWEEMYERAEEKLGRRLKTDEELLLSWLFKRYEEEEELKEKQQ